jgi:hypothetical protein
MLGLFQVFAPIPLREVSGYHRVSKHPGGTRIVKKYFASFVIVSTLSVTAATLYAQNKYSSRSAEGATSGWNYLTVVRGRSTVETSKFPPTYGWTAWETTIDNKTVESAELPDILNQFGSQGWELVSTSTFSRSDSQLLYLFFRRHGR